MKIDPQFIKIINEKLTGVLVLKEVGYQDSDIRRNEDHNLHIRCPIHKESVFHSLSLDDGKRAFVCAYPLCPSNKGGSFFDLYCMISRKDEESAIIFWSNNLKIDVQDLVKKFVAQAEDAVANNDLDNAILNYEKSIALVPEQVKLREKLLALLLKQSKKNAAIVQCLQLGKITLAQKQMTPAIKYFQDALALSESPKEDTYQSIADIYMADSQDGLLKEFLIQQSREENDLPTRQIILNILTSMEPDNAAYLRARADVEIELKHVNNALLSLRELLQILEIQQDFPNMGETLRQLTQIDSRSLEWKKRLVFYELQHGDKLTGASLALQCAQSLQKNKQGEEAIRLLAEARQSLSNSLDLNLYYADLLISDKKNAEAVTTLKQGLQQSLDTKDYTTASIYCKKTREIDPADLSLQHIQIEIAIHTGNKKEAATMYQSLADEYIKLKDHTKAVSMLEAALEIDTDDNSLREKMAGLMAQQNNVKQAIEQHLILLNKSLSKNDYGHAEKIVQQILSLDRDNITAVEHLINIYRKSRKIDKEFSAIFDLAKIYLRLDNPRQVKYYCDIILEKNPGFDEAHQLLIGMEKRLGRKMVYIRRLATHYIHNQKNKEALKLYNNIYESLPNNLSNLLNRIYALEKLDTPPQELKKHYLEIVQKSEKTNKIHIAFEYLNKALHIDESDLELHEYNIRLFKKYSDIRSSLKDREQLVEMMTHLYQAFIKKNLVLKAIELVKEIIQLIPENMEYHYQLAGLYIQQKNHPLAIAQFLFLQDKTLRTQDFANAEKLGLQVLELDKENLTAIHNLIDVYQHTRKTDKEQDLVYTLAKILFVKGEFSKSRQTALYGYRKFKQTDLFIKLLIDTEARKGRQAVYLNWFANHYFKQNKLNEALICLNKISDLIPGHLRTMLNRINILESLKIPAPELVKIYLSTAEQAIAKKQITIALTLLDKALRLDKTDAGIWERKIDLFQKHIDYKHSDTDLKVYQQLLKDARKLYTEQNDYPRSIALLHELLVLQPEDRKVRLELAELYILNDESSQALEQYLFLLKASVDDKNILDSEKLAKEIEHLSPNNIVVSELLLLLYRATGNQDKEIAILFNLSQIQVKSDAARDAYKNLLLLLSISSKYEPAIRLLIEIESREVRKSVFIRRLGDLYREQKKYSEALALYRSSLKLIPDNLSLQYRIVDILQNTKTPPAELTNTYIGIVDSSIKHHLPTVALTFLDKTIQLNSTVSEYYLRKISILKTIYAGTQSPETKTTLLDVMISLAALYTQQKQSDNAIVMLQDILEIQPENRDIREQLTALLISRKSVPEAIVQYAILLDQYTLSNELPKAQACAERIIEFDQENIPTLQKLIGLYAQMKNLDKEIECLIQLARWYQGKQQIKDARETCFSILRKLPLHPTVQEILLQMEDRNLRKAVYLRRLGDLNKSQKKLTDAVGVYRKALDLADGNLSLQYRIAEILQTIKTTPTELTKLYLGIVESALKHQQYSVSITYMDKAIDLNPTDARFYVKKIDILKNHYASKASLDIKNHTIQVMTELASLYTNQKQPDKSISLYREILELNPELLEIRGLLTELLISQKSVPDAIEQYSVLLNQYFDSGDLKNTERVGLRIIELDQENIPTLLKLIELYEQLKNPQREIECLIHLSRVYQNRKQISDVRTTCYTILRKAPYHPTVLEILLQVEDRNYRKAVYLRRFGDLNKTQKKLNDAVGLYRKALELVAGNLSLQYRIADILQTIKTTPAEITKLYLGIVDSAIKHQQSNISITYMDKAIDLNPTDARFYVKKIDILKNQYTLNASLDIRNLTIQVMTELASLYTIQKQPDKAINLYREILELNLELLEIRGLLTELLISQKSVPDAIEQYSVLLTQYYDSRDMKNAERVGLRIIELQKDNIPVLHKLVLIYAEQNNTSKELEFLFKLAVLYHSTKQLKDSRHSCWLILQKSPMHPAVIELLLQMESRNPRKAVYIRRLATFDLKAGKMAEGISRYRKVIELVPENLGTWKTLSSLLERSKANPSDIKTAYQKVVQIAVKMTQIPLAIDFLDKARALDAKDLGLYEQKIALYRKYYDITKDTHKDYLLKLMVELADVYANTKNTSSALLLYKEILDLSSTQQNIRIKYADLNAFTKKPQEAIEQYFLLVNEFLSAKIYASVDTYCRKILDLEKTNIPAWQVLVNIYQLQSNRTALIDALLNIAAIYRNQKATGEIISHGKQVLRLQADNENALQFLAEAETRISRKSIYLRRIAQLRINANKLQDAMEYYRKIMSLLPQNIGTKIALSVLLEKAKASVPDLKSIYLMVVDNAIKRLRIPLAIEFLDKAYHLDKKDLSLFEKKLGLYRKHYDIKQEDYRDAFISMMAELAEAWQKTPTPDKSIALYKEILTMDENRLDIREELAVLYAILDNSKDAIDQCYQLIDQYYSRQDYKNAEKVAKRVLELDQQHIPAIQYLVKIYHQTNQTTNEIETLLTLGGIYRSQASVKTACQTCHLVLRIHHENEPALVMLAEMENRKGRKSVYIRRLADIKFKNKKLAEAIDYYRRIQISLPDNLGTKITLASLLEKAKVNNIEIKTAYLSITDTAVKKNKIPLAIEYIDKARKLDPKDIALYENKITLFRGYYDLQNPEYKNSLFAQLVELARIYAGANNKPQAISLYHESLQLMPDRADIRIEYADINAGVNNNESIGQYFQLLELYLSQKEYKKSEELCRKVLVLDKENIPALHSLIRIYHDQNNVNQEIETLLFLANLHRMKKTDNEARHCGKSILRLNPQHEAALILLAEMESRKGRKSIYLRRLAILKLAQKKGSEAITYYRDIFQLLPQNLGTQLTLSNLLEKAKITSSDLKALYLHIADTAYKKTKVPLAIDFLDKAYRLDLKDLGIFEKKIQYFREYYDIAQVQYRQELISMLIELSESFQAVKSITKAILVYLDVLALEPELLDIRNILAGLFITQKQVSEAIGQYSYLLEHYYNHQDYKNAEEMSQCILSLDSSNIFATEYRVRIFQAAKDTPKQIESLIQLASLYQKAKQGKTAMGFLLQVLKLQPQHETALSTLVELETRIGRKAIYIRRIAILRFKQNKLNEAVVLVKKIRELLPENLGSQLSLISLLEKSNVSGTELKSHYLQIATLAIKYQKKALVLEYYDKVRKLDPKDLSVYELKINYYKTSFDVTREDCRNELLTMQEELADAYQTLNEPDKATVLLNEILAVVPGNLDVRTKLALLYNKLKKTKETAEQFTILFNAYLEKKAFDFAEKIGQQILVLDSNNPDALENMVRLYRSSGDNTKLLSSLSRLSQLQFKQKLYREARYSCRAILELSQDHEISIKMLIEMESQKARKAVRIRRLAMLYVNQNKYTEATNQYKRILDLVPDNLSTLLSITHILEVSKARNTDLINIYQTVSRIYEKKSKFDQGLEYINRIIQLNPSEITDHERKLTFLKKYFDVSSPGQYRDDLISELRLLSELHLNNKNLDQAIQLFREIIGMIPGDLALQEKLAVVYQEHKNLENAYQLFKSLSATYTELKDFAGVKRVLEKALHIKDNDIAALKTLSELEIQANNHASAIKYLTTIADISTQSQTFEDVYNSYQRILEIDSANFDISMKYVQVLASNQQNERAVKILGNILFVMETQKDELKVFKILSKILEIDPNNIVALEKLAVIYASHGKTQDALKAYQRLAGIYRQKGEMEHALKIYQMALELSPKDYDIRRDLADIHAELGLREEALFQYMTLVQEFFNDSHFEEAILELDKILKIDASHIKAQKLLCDAYYSLRQFANAYPYLISLAQHENKHNNPDTAIGYLKKAIQIKPDDLVPLEMLVEIFHHTTSSAEDIPYYVQLADIYVAKQQYDQSRILLEEAFGMDPFNKEIYSRLIQEYLRTKNTQQAIKTAFYIAQLYFDKGQYPESEAIARKHLELQPDFLDGHYFLISIYQRINKPRELTNEYLEIAKITASQGAFDQAINAYENAIQLNPNVFSLRDHLIDLLVKIGRKEEAVRELNNLASTYQEQRKSDMALMVFRKAVELDPDNLQLRQSTFNLAKQILPEESLIDDYMGMAGVYFRLNQIELGWNLCKDIFRIGPGEVKNYKQLFTFMDKIPNRPETARYLVKMCDYFTKKKIYDFAVQSGEKAMMFEGANPQLVENIAFSYANSGNIPRATDYYQVLINLYKMKGSTNKVLDNYRSVLELSPFNIPMHQAYIEYFLEGGLEEELLDEFLALTDAFIHHQEWQNAMSMVDKVMRIDPTNDKAFEKMNLIGEMEAKATKILKSASPKATPAPAAPSKPISIPTAQFSHPNATSRSPQKPEEPTFTPDDTIGTRIMGYIRTLEINPNHYVARTKLIELYMQKNQKEEAIAQYMILSDTYASLEDYSKAVETLQKLLALKPDHADAKRKLTEYQRNLSDGS